MRAAIESGEGWTLPAVPSNVGQLRRRATAFASAAGAPAEIVQAVALAVSETVTNVVIHAYSGKEPGPVSVSCRPDGERLVIEVADEGRGVAPRHDSPGIGQGLALVGAMVQSLDVACRPDGRGTVVTMTFGPSAQPRDVPGLEHMCALAVETVADVSCVDVASGGVLRRAAAEVAGEPELTDWLRGALPPAKPGTATWAALREGGARLVVHDPSVPRSPGGTGERLGLRWWVSVPVDVPEMGTVALWGLGGRLGGREVPSEELLRALDGAAHTDLTIDGPREALRAQLAPEDERP